MYSSFNLWTQPSLSRGPAFVFKVGMEATVLLVASSTIFTSKFITTTSSKRARNEMHRTRSRPQAPLRACSQGSQGRVDPTKDRDIGKGDDRRLQGEVFACVTDHMRGSGELHFSWLKAPDFREDCITDSPPRMGSCSPPKAEKCLKFKLLDISRKIEGRGLCSQGRP